FLRPHLVGPRNAHVGPASQTFGIVPAIKKPSQRRSPRLPKGLAGLACRTDITVRERPPPLKRLSPSARSVTKSGLAGPACPTVIIVQGKRPQAPRKNPSLARVNIRRRPTPPHTARAIRWSGPIPAPVFTTTPERTGTGIPNSAPICARVIPP